MTADVWERLGVEAGIKHYIEVRNRLQRPPNAVADSEIELRKKNQPPPQPPHPSPPPNTEDTVSRRITEILARYPPLPKKRLSITTITDCVAEAFGLTPVEIRLPSRRPKYVFPRHVAIYLAKRLTKKSSLEIAISVHLVDHTTVIHAARKIANMIQADPDLATRIEAIEASIRAKYQIKA